MVSHEIEIYRTFRVWMILEETPTHWTCSVTFERTDTIEPGVVPLGFWWDADKRAVNALNFSMAMQYKARAVIDDWLASRKL
jgi:hypothetical protein